MSSLGYKILKLSDPEIVAILDSGGTVVLPTDTVYGIVCKAADEQAVSRFYKLKARENKPGTVIASSIDQLVELGIKRRYLKAVEQYWPGPISIEIPHGVAYLNQSTGRQAFRVVDDADLVRLLNKTGSLLTSSCNQPGEKPADNIDEAVGYFGDQVGAYVDGGDLSERKPSTLIRIIDDAVEVIREGAVKINEAGGIEDQL